LIRAGEVQITGDLRAGERAARVTVGGDADHLVIVAISGERLPISEARRGLTIAETAHVAHTLGLAWALNVDGGHSSSVWIGRTVYPRGIFPRRPGPVRLQLIPAAAAPQ
jgi:exopolysaccharide biosynthesis protein